MVVTFCRNLNERCIILEQFWIQHGYCPQKKTSTASSYMNLDIHHQALVSYAKPWSTMKDGNDPRGSTMDQGSSHRDGTHRQSWHKKSGTRTVQPFLSMGSIFLPYFPISSRTVLTTFLPCPSTPLAYFLAYILHTIVLYSLPPHFLPNVLLKFAASTFEKRPLTFQTKN